MSESPVADLHLHTTASDGRLTVAELPAAARHGGVTAVAVTDHDRVHSDLAHPVAVHDEVTIIRGIELRVETDTQRIDLLGYGVDPTRELTAELDRLQADRIDRAQRIIDRVERETGVDLALTPKPGVGRPHIARALTESSAPYSYQEAFDELIGADGPCYVAREITPVDRGVDLLQDSCRLVGLAHPLRYDDPKRALELAADLDAVERYYPYGREISDAERTLVESAIERNDLLATGGSDAHDKTLGVAGPPEPAFERFRRRFER